MAAFRNTGLEVSGHKVGPDYIDPGYHALATERPGRNLDPHLVGEELIVPLLLHGASTPGAADLAVIEGVMGLYDGRLGTGGFASTAHVAKLTRTPVVLVVDVSGQSRTVAALVAGLAAHDDQVRVGGVILNRARPGRNLTEIETAILDTGTPVLGAIPDDEQVQAPSRHLGLIPTAEFAAAADVVAHLGARIAQHVDLAAVHEIARSAPELAGPVWQPELQMSRSESRPLVAMAGGRAFTFCYQETRELLEAAGCRVVTFDPTHDPRLPDGTQAIYLGGGFPEAYVTDLSANESLRQDLRRAVLSGVPTVAECAGLLYLSEQLDGVDMSGALPTVAQMSPRLTLRYPIATAASDSLLTRAGEEVSGHEFHRTVTTPVHGAQPAWLIDDEPSGFANPSLHASYLHVHWAGHPRLAQRFVDAAASTPPHRPLPMAANQSTANGKARPQPLDPLRHHGDQEVGPGLLDFAVNTYPEAPPDWLQDALRTALDEVGSYPDAQPARRAVAGFHGRDAEEVLVTAGAAEAFSLLARLRRWRRPVVVHPQFTEPHAALLAHGHRVIQVVCSKENGFRLEPEKVPPDADLVVIGNPTNPTGVLHPAEVLESLRRPGRLLVVDEAFLDSIPEQPETLLQAEAEGLLVIRSLTKLWGIPGIRAGYVVGHAPVVSELAELQSPWSVSTPAIAATISCTTEQAAMEARIRTQLQQSWRTELEEGLDSLGIERVPSRAPFVLARPGHGAHQFLQSRGVAVRRGDTFPGLGQDWIRIAARPPETTRRLLTALSQFAARSEERHL
jgi:cobyrinic acid a,c-diamide synthase